MSPAPDPSIPADRPFIIWTLRRTGGTNLTRHLVDRSSLRGVEHEPFNKGRVFGHVSESWKTREDAAVLRKQLREVCAKRRIIKHAVELTPLEISQALAECAGEFGYGHLFLYRRQAKDRLISLHFARQSGVWGPKGAGQAMDEAAVFTESLPVDKLVDHERQCVRRLQAVWDTLSAREPKPIALAFEDVYQAPAETAARILQPVLDGLGLSRGAASDQSLIEKVLAEGNQGTQSHYAKFQGGEALEAALAQVVPFNPA